MYITNGMQDQNLGIAQNQITGFTGRSVTITLRNGQSFGPMTFRGLSKDASGAQTAMFIAAGGTAIRHPLDDIVSVNESAAPAQEIVVLNTAPYGYGNWYGGSGWRRGGHHHGHHGHHGIEGLGQVQPLWPSQGAALAILLPAAVIALGILGTAYLVNQ